MSRASGDRSLSVLDPMCGSGTVLSAACAEGHHAQGFDVDPLAVLMSSVAVQPTVPAALEEEANRVIRAARRSRTRALPWPDKETAEFAQYWFGDAQRTALNRLSRQINEISDQRLRETLQLSLSRTIVTKAPKASLAADTSHSRPHRVRESSTFDVLEGFGSSVRQVERFLEQRDIDGTATVQLGDARRLQVPSASIDLVVTSPPYLNAIDYLRGHRLSLIWLGYSIGELRTIRSGAVGAERALDCEPDATTLRMVQDISKLVPDSTLLPARILERYARDLTVFAAELHRVCKPGGQVVVVIGNSTLKGNFIRNDLLVRKALKNAQFKLTSTAERSIPESSRYLPLGASSANSPISKRMRTEVVIGAHRAKADL